MSVPENTLRWCRGIRRATDGLRAEAVAWAVHSDERGIDLGLGWELLAVGS